jgi:DNA-directed RNA polymerase specialized sigma24 family protein
MTCQSPAPDTAARDALLAGLRGWLYELSFRFHQTAAVSQAEFYGELVYDVLRFAHRYDPSRGRATTWAFQVARHTRTRLAQAAAKRDLAGRLTVSLGESEHPDEVVPGREEPEPLDVAAAAEEMHHVRAAVAALPRTQREVVSKWVGLGGRPPATVTQLARELGMGREKTLALLDKALLKLRTTLRPLRPSGTC